MVEICVVRLQDLMLNLTTLDEECSARDEQ